MYVRPLGMPHITSEQWQQAFERWVPAEVRASPLNASLMLSWFSFTFVLSALLTAVLLASWIL
jgi:hypothetical protein